MNTAGTYTIGVEIRDSSGAQLLGIADRLDMLKGKVAARAAERLRSVPDR